MRDPRKLFVVVTFLAAIMLPATRLLMHLGGDLGEVQPAWAASSCGNAIVEPPEQCDPPGSLTCPSGLPLSLACSANCTCPRPLDHFQCYEIKPGAFVNQSVTVQDQFGTVTEMVRFPHRLCNPTNKNGEGIIDPTNHLVGYELAAPKFTKRTNQTIVNQFGTTLIDVVRPDLLMVPTAKDGVPVLLPPVDHFQCYKVKRSKGAAKFTQRTVSIANQFETVTVTVVKPVRLCAPANKNSEDPTAPSHPEHLLCYKTKATPFGQSAHTIDNQFGSDDVTVIHRRELCLPSFKNPPTTTTTTTTTSTTHATTTSSSTTTTSTSTTTSTTHHYGSPSRAFLEPAKSLLE